MIGIKDLFKEEELSLQSDGNYKTICPDCDLQGGRTEGFILFPETNTSYCHSSHKTFNFLETAGLKLDLIKCLDGKDAGQHESILDNDEELINEILETVEEVYGIDMKEAIINSNYNKKEISLPVTGKLIGTFCVELSKIISNKNILFYRNDIKQIVEIRKIFSKTNEKCNGFTTITPNRFITLIERYSSPGVYIKNKKTEETEFHKKSLNSTLGAVVIESHYLQDKLPKITRIFSVPIPIMYKGELTFPNKGYDYRFESWLPYTSPEIDINMSLEEAKNIIKNLFEEFCFKDDANDKTNAIAALLSPFLKGLFKSFNVRTPVPFYIANRERAGKDYLAGITGIVYEGSALEEPPISNNDNKTNNNDELRKKILSAMIAGRKRLHFSNNKGYINNAVFESISTASQFSDRALGRNETLTFDNELDLSLSGNVGVTYTPDFANRCRFINLFLDIEDANSRTFKNPDLHGWVRDNRGVVLSAMFSLVRNWKDKGFPCGTLPFTSFQEWASVCGGIMEAAGYKSPCKQNSLLVIGGDKETNDFKRLFEVCYEESKGKGIGRDDIINIIRKEELLPYYNFENKQDMIKFGIKLSKFTGRIFSDIRLNTPDNVVGSRKTYIFEKMAIPNNSVQVVQDVQVENPAVANQLLKSYNLYSKPIQPIQPIQDFGEKNINYVINLATTLQKQSNLITTPQNQPKPKSDREVQFFEAEECKSIIQTCTKEDILNWIKENQNYDYKVMYDKFGVGSMKFEAELKREGLI